MRIRQTMMAAAILAAGTAMAEPEQSGTTIHEWGTFTALQNEQGKAIGGVNVDDEPVPGFVHRLYSSMSDILSKGVPAANPSVTMRLETPVLYFHPPKGAAPFAADVHVEFRQGWLTEFYPQAAAAVNNKKVEGAVFQLGDLTEKTLGTLTWTKLNVGTHSLGPETKATVWLAPRQVDAAGVSATSGESEKYLFYRGVGHLDSLIRVARDGKQFHLYSQMESAKFEGATVKALWLVDIRKDGSCAFRPIEPLALSGDPNQVLASVPVDFDASAYGPVQNLREDMKRALVKDGLYDDEAAAMLNTWELSYFKSPGLRLFYLVPQGWTDYYLPLSVSASGQTIDHIQRTMVGRIEIVTPQQRQLAREVVEARAHRDAAAERKAYYELGRFREALIMDQSKNSARTASAK